MDAWQQLLKEWRRGPASGREAALGYTYQHPKKFGGWLVLADTLAGMARYAEARQALRTAARSVPPSAKSGLFEAWGQFYRDKNDLKRAEAWYRKALKACKDTRHYILLGGVLAKQGRLAEAMKAHRDAIKCATPGQPVDEALLNLGLIHRSQRQYGRAIACFKRALAVDPRYKAAREALRDVQNAVARSPSR
jgi:tetratricopeptide (TPR) repeat protein